MENIRDDPNYTKLKEMWERCQSSPESSEKLNNLLNEILKAANSQIEIYNNMGIKEGTVQLIYNNQFTPMFYPPVMPNLCPVNEGQNQQFPNQFTFNQEQMQQNQSVLESSYSYYDSYTAGYTDFENDYNEYDDDEVYLYYTEQSSCCTDYARDDYYSSEFGRQEDDIYIPRPQRIVQAPLSSELSAETVSRDLQEEIKELPVDEDFEKAAAKELPEETVEPVSVQTPQEEVEETEESLNGLKFDADSRTIIKEGVGKIRFIFPLDSSRFTLKSNMILDKTADISMLKEFATFCPTEVTFENFDVNGKNDYDEILKIFCRKTGVKLISYDEQDKRLTFRVNKLNQYPITLPQL